MTGQAAEDGVLANLRDALDKITKASRVIIVHPDSEDAVDRAVAQSPFPGLLEVVVSAACPPDRVFLIPKLPGLRSDIGDGRRNCTGCGGPLNKLPDIGVHACGNVGCPGYLPGLRSGEGGFDD